MADTNEALKEAGLNFKGTVKARHLVEVLIEDVGFDAMKAPVVKPLEGMKIVGYVGCQANVEIYQSEINKKKGTKLSMPVVYYSQLMTVAYGGSAKQAGLDGNILRPQNCWILPPSKLASVARSGGQGKFSCKT